MTTAELAALLRDTFGEARGPTLWDDWLAVAARAQEAGGVVVAEGEYVNGRVYDDKDAPHYVSLGKRLAQFVDGQRVVVSVRAADAEGTARSQVGSGKEGE